MTTRAFVVALLFGALPAVAAAGHEVSIRATTAAVTVTGGAAAVSATLFDANGTVIPGLVVERTATGASIVLAAAVRPGARIELRVPTETNLRIEASNGGPVTVRAVRGQLEIVNSNAAIALEGVSGTVVASTSNGAITATMTAIDPAWPMSFLTSNGAIDVTFPAAFKGALCMESDGGPIATDFSLAPAAAPVERTILRGGRLRTLRCGTVNGGGLLVQMRTENAPIRVRKGS